MMSAQKERQNRRRKVGPDLMIRQHHDLQGEWWHRLARTGERIEKLQQRA